MLDIRKAPFPKSCETIFSCKVSNSVIHIWGRHLAQLPMIFLYFPLIILILCVPATSGSVEPIVVIIEWIIEWKPNIVIIWAHHTNRNVETLIKLNYSNNKEFGTPPINSEDWLGLLSKMILVTVIVLVFQTFILTFGEHGTWDFICTLDLVPRLGNQSF